MKSKLKSFGKGVVSVLFVALITLLLLEGVLRFFYHNHHLVEKIPGAIKYIQKLDGSRNIVIQYDPNCAKYDPDLSYILRSEGCVFEGKEFSTSYQVNSQGLRDDENSLSKPEIIVLGDSYGMGWGVEQNETFANLIEKETGKKTLNAAISSYGTARQYLSLKKRDLSKLEYVILQYCINDYGENKHFIENNFNLEVMDLGVYEGHVVKGLKKKKKNNKFLRMSSIVIRELIRDIKKPSVETKAGLAEDNRMEEFANLALLIDKIKEVKPDAKIILFEAHLGAKTHNDDLFNYFSANKVDNVAVFDSAKILNREDYFDIDVHYNASGHYKISQKITEILSKE